MPDAVGRTEGGTSAASSSGFRGEICSRIRSGIGPAGVDGGIRPDPMSRAVVKALCWNWALCRVRTEQP